MLYAGLWSGQQVILLPTIVLLSTHHLDIINFGEAAHENVDKHKGGSI